MTKKKGAYMKGILALIVLQVFVYTWVHLYLSYKVQTELAPVVSVAFYSFCGFEAGVCGYIKKCKIGKESNEDA